MQCYIVNVVLVVLQFVAQIINWCSSQHPGCSTPQSAQFQSQQYRYCYVALCSPLYTRKQTMEITKKGEKTLYGSIILYYTEVMLYHHQHRCSDSKTSFKKAYENKEDLWAIRVNVSPFIQTVQKGDGLPAGGASISSRSSPVHFSTLHTITRNPALKTPQQDQKTRKHGEGNQLRMWDHKRSISTSTALPVNSSDFI